MEVVMQLHLPRSCAIALVALFALAGNAKAQQPTNNTLAAPTPSFAQSPLTDRLHAGDRIRATIGPVRFDATIRSIKPDSIQIATSDRLQMLPAMYLKDVDLAIGRRGHGGNGAVIGGVAGATVGSLFGMAVACIFTCDGHQPVKAGLEGAIAGGASLGLIGGLIGSLIRTTTWERVETK
jgi:hypothetical protein